MSGISIQPQSTTSFSGIESFLVGKLAIIVVPSISLSTTKYLFFAVFPFLK
jgi:hypothetical protein